MEEKEIAEGYFESIGLLTIVVITSIMPSFL